MRIYELWKLRKQKFLYNFKFIWGQDFRKSLKFSCSLQEFAKNRHSSLLNKQKTIKKFTWRNRSFIYLRIYCWSKSKSDDLWSKQKICKLFSVLRCICVTHFLWPKQEIWTEENTRMCKSKMFKHKSPGQFGNFVRFKLVYDFTTMGTITTIVLQKKVGFSWKRVK